MKLQNLIKKIMFLIPTKLPIGVTEFEAWASDIIAASGFPDNDSLRFTLATMILHMEAVSKIEINLLIVKLQIPMSGYKSKRYFAQSIRKSAANQVANGMMHELKARQEARMKEEAAERAKAEADKAAGVIEITEKVQ